MVWTSIKQQYKHTIVLKTLQLNFMIKLVKIHTTTVLW